MSTGNGTPYSRRKNILLAGVPGIGKTTVIRKIAACLGALAGGVVTEELRERGRRVGFTIESLCGEKMLMATTRNLPGPKIGRYTVIVENLEKVGIAAIERALDDDRIVLVDEIGKMEMLSLGLRQTILKALDSRSDTVSTLGVARHPFLDCVRSRDDVRVFEVTLGNRDTLPGDIVAMLRGGQVRE